VSAATRSTNSEAAGPGALGRTEPRLWTPPLVELTPETSYGFDVAAFARDVLDAPLDPWQEWLVIHAGELLPDSRPRFRQVLALVARQNGKTHLCKVLALYWLFVERQRLILGMSTNLDYAREAWTGAVELARDCEYLAAELHNVRLANGEQCLTTTSGCRYRIAASNRRGGRSLTINRMIIDELREHAKWDAWNAALPAMGAVYDAQVWCITNQGDDTSVVLDSLRGAALAFLETGEGSERLGIFEWSAPDGAEPDDLDALAMANPSLGRRMDPDVLVADARRAAEAGGEELAGFRTEIMCQRVHLIDPAIEPGSWTACGADEPIDLAVHRDRLALCVDVALDGSHASVVACALVDGVAHAEVVGSWAGFGCTQALRADLPALVAKVRPKVLGWFPNGPAAAMAADLGERKGRRDWPPRGVELQELRAEQTAVCMGLAEQVRAENVRHPRDPMLDVHIQSAQKLRRGDAWVFGRQGVGPIDGAYALAGALHMARTMRVRAPLVAL
jgi:hypothetical protein